jgi:hypothetical protein
MIGPPGASGGEGYANRMQGDKWMFAKLKQDGCE